MAKQRSRKQGPEAGKPGRSAGAKILDAGGRSWSSRLLALLLCLIAMALAAGVYDNTLHNPFVYDDRVSVVENHSIRNLGNLRAIVEGDLFRPVVNLSYAVDHHSWQLNPFGYHLSNLLLHIINVALLFVVGLRLTRDRQVLAGRPLAGGQPAAAFAAAALLAVHPVLSEAVGYTSGRSELLCTGFLLLAFLALRRFLLGSGRLWLLPGLGCFVLALACKETAAMLPFLLLAWDRLLATGAPLERRRLLVRFHLPFIAFVVVAGLARIAAYLLMEGQTRHETLAANLLVEAVVVWRYLLLLVWPASLSIVHDVRRITSIMDPAAAAAIAGILVLCCCLYLLRRRLPLAVLGMVWFLLLLAPSHLFPLQEAMAEHRLYTASCGFFLAVAALFGLLLARLEQHLARPRLVAAGLLVPVLLVLAVLTVTRNRVWSDQVDLWRDAAMKAPGTWAAQYGLAEALRADGRCAEAIPVYTRAITILPDQLEPYLNRGICQAQVGEHEEARQSFLAARHVDADSPKPYNNLGTLAMLTGEPRQASAWFSEAIRHDPMNLIARQQLVHLYEGPLHDPAQALALCREIKSIAPGTPGINDCIKRNRQRVTGP